WKDFRFTTRHLLMLTAILAVMFTIFRVGVSCNTVFWAAIAALGAGWYWVYRTERRREAERQQQREMLLKIFGRADEVPEGADEAALAEPRGFKFSFSMRQL